MGMDKNLGAQAPIIKPRDCLDAYHPRLKLTRIEDHFIGVDADRFDRMSKVSKSKVKVKGHYAARIVDRRALLPRQGFP